MCLLRFFSSCPVAPAGTDLILIPSFRYTSMSRSNSSRDLRIDANVAVTFLAILVFVLLEDCIV